MISYQEALKIIREVSVFPKIKVMPLPETLGLRLADDVRAPEALPAFANSAMDGWAVRVEDLANATRQSPQNLCIQGEISAGDAKPWVLEPQKTLRIFTGAVVPKGATAVIAQEEVQESQGMATFMRMPKLGENIRLAGEDVRKGETLLKKDSRLGPGQIGVLAALGVRNVRVHALPRVGHLATGSELVAFDQNPCRGQIRDCVGPLLQARLKEMGMAMHSLGIVRDEQQELEATVGKVLENDVAILTGGVSVGKYDGVREALARWNVETLFWKVDMKPGKPIYFGKRGKTFVFGLPGNPLSALVGFELFVRPLLKRLRGEPLGLPGKIPLKSGYLRRGGRKTHVITVAITQPKGQAMPLTPQGSHRVGQLARANGLAILSGNRRDYATGVSVPVYRMGPG